MTLLHLAAGERHARLFPSPPRPPNSPLKVIKHGDSTAEDREHVSDDYAARGWDGD